MPGLGMKTAKLVFLVWACSATAAMSSAYSQFNAGIAAETNENHADAVKLMTQALSAPDLPDHLRPTALQVRAEAYIGIKRYELAIDDFTAALALRPQNYDLLIERGSVYGEEKKFDLARGDFATAIRLRPELEQAYVSHAAANLAQEKYDDAIKDYTDAIQISPDDVDLVLLRAEANRLASRFDKAMTDYDAAIRNASRYSTAYSLRAFAHLESGDLRGAVSDYDEALDIDPNDPELQEAAGFAQWDYGDYRAAARQFAKSLVDPKRAPFSTLWLHLATIKRGNRDDDLATRAAKLDLKAWPGPLVSLYAGMASEDQVFDAAKQGDEDVQKDHLCEANFFVGEWHLERKEDAAARTFLQTSASSCPRGLPESYAARAEYGKLKP